MPGESKKGGGLKVGSAYKKQAFGEAVSPFVMKGSPHKLGTIEGTEAHKASMAKFTVEQTRTSGDPSLVTAGSELGSSYVPGAIDYSIKTGFKIDSKGKKKNGGKKRAVPVDQDKMKESYVDTMDTATAIARANQKMRQDAGVYDEVELLKIKPKAVNVEKDDKATTSFGDAFKAARKAHGGDGGIFEWRGKKYTTDTKK